MNTTRKAKPRALDRTCSRRLYACVFRAHTLNLRDLLVGRNREGCGYNALQALFVSLWTLLSLLAFSGIPASAAADQQTVTVNWLGAAPAAPEGVSWGIPWPKGKLQKGDSLVLRTADGTAVPMQTWPLAYWPDGSIKWSGHAIGATTAMTGPLEIASGSVVSAATPVKVTSDGTAIEIDTGAARCRFSKQGSYLFDSMFVGDRKVAENARLIVRLEDRSEETNGVLRQVEFVSQITNVTVEQSGPVRSVIKVDGFHTSARTNRSWLPFTVRFYFYAGQASVRLVHSFIFDGDPEKDFIKGMGISVAVPFQEELHNRHVRFVGDGTGVWCQPVRLLPGYRNALSPEEYAAHLAGKRMPNLAEFWNRAAMESVAVYNDFKLTQPGPDGFSIDKRTQDRSSWLHVTNGRRSLGLAGLADVSGGIAVGVKDFWQKYPASIEINNAASPAGELTVWLWSPDGPAMDLRTYDVIPHGLQTNYEDWKPGWGTAHGIAHTAELTLWAFPAIPSDADLVNLAKASSAPPMLVCTPQYYHSIPVFGRWSLPDKSTPTKKWIEDQVAQLYTYYHDQVDQRNWYGFWDYGDIMHNYDFGRHDWRYDIGGWAWANTELMPDMFLWYTFLRTGRADAFRMAEAMTRHTSEVDVYHLGPFAPLGSRHNVNHWGDGAKQPRISHSGIKEFYYFLTTDERVGDLIREQLDADLTYALLQRYNGSHYVPTPDGGGRLQNPLGVAAPRPGELGPRPTTRSATARLGLEWMCYAMNWTVEWERTGDTKWRDRVADDMKAMAAGIGPDGRLPGGYFDMIFGGPENLFEMEPMYDIPQFWKGWANTCEAVGRQVDGSEMTGPRMLAYAAWAKKDAELGKLAWDKLIGDAVIGPTTVIPQPRRVSGPEVVHPVDDPVFLGRSVDWQLHGVASIQWALNAIETLELAGEYLPQWEASQKADGK